MKTLFELFRRFDARCIFGSIRRLGGMSRPKVKCYDLLSTRALQVEGDTPLGLIQRICFIFLSTPSGWRATALFKQRKVLVLGFLSTPSGWRATRVALYGRRCWIISIHALRVEGDYRTRSDRTAALHFYPRPPGGGRHESVDNMVLHELISIHALRVEGDRLVINRFIKRGISIHALRVEGD